MWFTVLLLAVVAAAEPVRVGAVVFMLSRPQPIRPLIACYMAGFAMNFAVGVLVIFVLQGAGFGKLGSLPGEVRIAVGLLVLLAGVLAGAGVPVLPWGRVRLPAGVNAGPESRTPEPAGGAVVVERLPGYTRLPGRARAALHNGSVWVACLAGLATGLPTAEHLVAMATILTSRLPAGPQIGALVVFNMVGFVMAEMAIIGLLVAPETIRARVELYYCWMKAHRRPVVATLAAVLGILFLLTGLADL